MWRGASPNEHTAAWGAHACGAEFHHNDDRGGDDDGDDDDGGDGESIVISEHTLHMAHCR